MNRWTLTGLSLLVLFLAWPEARGNAPYVPTVQQAKRTRDLARRPALGEVRLVVRIDAKAETVRLQVPLNLLRGPDDPPAATPRRGAGAGRFGLPTIVAGLALTLAFATGGLWLVRRGARRSLVVLVVLSLFAAGTAAVWANVGAPRPPRPVPPAPPVKAALPELKLPGLVELPDKLILEPVGAGDHLTLIVPPSMVPEKGKEGKDKEILPPAKRPD